MTLYNSGLGGGDPIQPKSSKDKLDDLLAITKAKNHSCTAEIIAELERLEKLLHDGKLVLYVVQDRIEELKGKAKETQL